MSMASSLSPNLKAKLVVVETSTKFSKPPDFTVPPPPIPHFVDPLAVGAGEGGCSHHPVVTEASEDGVAAADKVVISFFSRLSFFILLSCRMLNELLSSFQMLTNNDLMHLSSYLIVGCILLMVLFTVAACSLRCCTRYTCHIASQTPVCHLPQKILKWSVKLPFADSRRKEKNDRCLSCCRSIVHSARISV